MFEFSDIEKLEQYFDDRYVKQADCDDRQQENNRKFANDDKRIELIMRDTAGIKKLLWAIASASIGTLVTAMLGLLLKL